MKTLDTHLWNLGTTSMAAAVLGLTAAACGPAVELEGDTDGGSETHSDTLIDPTTDTEPERAECLDDDDCSTNFDCIDGECVYDPPPDDCDYDYDYDYGCYCVYGHCSPPYYYDCYGDEDCLDGELCQGGYCDPVQTLPACDAPASALEVPVPIPTDDPVVSLAFVDLDSDAPGEALVVATDAQTLLLEAGSEPVALPPLPSPVRDAAAADLDGDGATDLALIHDAGLTILYDFGAPTQEARDAPTPDPATTVQVYRPAESAPSLVLRTTANQAFVVDGLADRTPSVRGVVSIAVASLHTLDDGLGTRGFVLNSFANDVSRFHFAEDASVEFGNYPRSGIVRELVTGSFGGEGEGSGDAVWATVHEGWTYLELLLDAQQYEYRALYFSYPRFAAGDLDGDGLEDVVALGAGGFVVMPGDAQWGMTCFAQGPLLSSALVLEAGDFDGDGLAEIATTTDTGQLALYDVSWSP
ncbi:MAG: FG-GAP repeat domain-containing protein [Nannocystaceae bacterium]|nr:VCBS repeat-containing protein [bacterium]